MSGARDGETASDALVVHYCKRWILFGPLAKLESPRPLPEQLLQILPNAGAKAGVFVPVLNTVMQRYQIVGAKHVVCLKLSPMGNCYFYGMRLLFLVGSKLSLVVMALRMVDARRVL